MLARSVAEVLDVTLDVEGIDRLYGKSIGQPREEPGALQCRDLRG